MEPYLETMCACYQLTEATCAEHVPVHVTVRLLQNSCSCVAIPLLVMCSTAVSPSPRHGPKV